MAQLLDTSISGSLAFLNSTVNTGSAGNIWYSSTLKKLQYSTCIGGTCSWAAGGAMIVARRASTGLGTQNEALAVGGVGGYKCTEEYNGTTWSTGGALITVRAGDGGAGTQNLGLIFSLTTEEYNGTSWATGGTLIQPRCGPAGAGTQNTGLAFGGVCSYTEPYAPYGPTFFNFPCTERYNGTSWSVDSNMTVARYSSANGIGSQNSALAAYGQNVPSAVCRCTEEYSGGAWSVGGVLINTRYSQPGGAGTQNQALIFSGGGDGLCSICSELYDGTSWSSVVALITSRWGAGGTGTVNASLAFGGRRCVGIYITPYAPYGIYNVYGNVSCTEEFTRTFATASV